MPIQHHQCPLLHTAEQTDHTLYGEVTNKHGVTTPLCKDHFAEYSRKYPDSSRVLKTECKCGKRRIKWVYVEDWRHYHLAKEQCCPICAFSLLKTVFKVVATVSTSPHQVVYRVYGVYR
jgi:hypothetical protein